MLKDGTSVPGLTLKYLFRKIEKLLREDKENRVQLCHNQYVAVSLYHKRHYVGFHRLDVHGAIIPGKGINLDLDEWQKFASHLPMLLTELNKTSLL